MAKAQKPQKKDSGRVEVEYLVSLGTKEKGEKSVMDKSTANALVAHKKIKILGEAKVVIIESNAAKA